MRALEIGLKIGTYIIKGNDFAVDVNEDLLKAIDLMPKIRLGSFIRLFWATINRLQIKNFIFNFVKK